jgi:hypothetical protein
VRPGYIDVMPSPSPTPARRGARVLRVVLATAAGVGLLLGPTACKGGGDSNGGADGGTRTSSAPAVVLR